MVANRDRKAKTTDNDQFTVRFWVKTFQTFSGLNTEIEVVHHSKHSLLHIFWKVFYFFLLSDMQSVHTVQMMFAVVVWQAVMHVRLGGQSLECIIFFYQIGSCTYSLITHCIQCLCHCRIPQAVTISWAGSLQQEQPIIARITNKNEINASDTSEHLFMFGGSITE